MNSLLSTLLKISEKYSYIYPVLSDSAVLRYHYGPMGELLRTNILNEWLFSNVMCRDGNVFPFYSQENTQKGFIDGEYTRIILLAIFNVDCVKRDSPTILQELKTITWRQKR